MMSTSEETKEWDGPSMKRLSEEGLGKGIDATNPQELLSDQILPTLENLERRTVGCGYQEVNETVETVASVKKSLSTSLRVDALQTVSFALKYNWQKEEKKAVRMRAQGKKIYRETVLFTADKISNSSCRLNNLLKTAAEQKGYSYDPGKNVPLKEREDICRNVIRNENQGATHYISSVDLGAIVYEVTVEKESMTESKNTTGTDIGGGVDGVTAKVGIDFSKELMDQSKTAERNINFIIDENVVLNGQHTSILAEQEKMIGYKVRPVWELVDDPDWSQSVKNACLEYFDDNSPIPVGADNPFLVKAVSHKQQASQYLKLSNGCVEGTPDREEADKFTLHVSDLHRNNLKKVEQPLDVDGSEIEVEKLSDPNYGFSLRYEASGGLHNYLAVDHESQTVNPKVNVDVEELATFFLSSPLGRNEMSISQWQSRTPLLLVCRHYKWQAFGSNFWEGFLVLEQGTDDSGLVLKEKTADKFSADEEYCQFSLEKHL